MSEIDKINGKNYNLQNNNEAKEVKKDIKLEDISVLYTTRQKEENRTDFANTFSPVAIMNSETGAKFIQGLKDNKSDLQTKLGLTDEQYDVLACVALGLASQETGMGEEDGYVGENTGLGGFFRNIGKWFSVTLGGDSSASSGLTQMKINDFMNGDKLTEEQKQILKDYGVETWAKNLNNLFQNPDLAAVSTMVVLSSIYDKYDDYMNVLKSEHINIGNSIAESPEQLTAIKEKGDKILDDVLNVYQNAPDDQKIKIRETFKQWFLSVNGSKIGDRVDKDYNEELQLNKLNELLTNNNADFTLDQESLHFIRYALTAEGEEMSVPEYLAYGWNKGTGQTGMQLDRMLAEKIGTILYNPEDFDYDQFTTNVAMLAQKYAQQSVSDYDLELMDEAFKELYGDN